MRATHGARLDVRGPPALVAAAVALPEVAEARAPRRLVRVAAAGGATGSSSPRCPSARPSTARSWSPAGSRGGRRAHAQPPLALAMGLGPGARMSIWGEQLDIVGVAVLPLASADGWVAPDQTARSRPLRPRRASPRPGGGRRRPAAARPGRRRRGRPAARRRGGGVSTTGSTRAATSPTSLAGPRDPQRLDAARPARHRLHAGDRDRRPRPGRPAPDRPPALGRRDARRVTAVLVGHYLTVTLLAAPVGLVGGRLLAPPLPGDTLALLGTPQPGPPGPALAAVVLLFALAAVALACALPAWRAGRLPPVVALQPVRVPAPRALARGGLARALRLPVTAALGAKDAYVQRARALLTVASLALAGAMVVCALAFETTMDRLATDPSLRAQPWEVAVFTDSMPPEQVDGLLASLPGVEAVGRRYGVLATARGLELETRVIDGSPSAFAFTVPDGRGVRRAGRGDARPRRVGGARRRDRRPRDADRRRPAVQRPRRRPPRRAGRRRPRCRGAGGPSRPRRCGTRAGSCGWPTASTPRAPRGRSSGWGRAACSSTGRASRSSARSATCDLSSTA